MCIATNSHDKLDEWKRCLSDYLPKTASPVHWVYWVAERSFLNVLSGKVQAELATVLEIVLEKHKKFRGVIPLALLSVGLKIIQDVQAGNVKHNHISSILTLLTKFDENEVVVEWLVGTKDWVWAFGYNEGKEIGDLLDTFLVQLEQLKKLGLVEQDKAYMGGVQFVNELKLQREALPRN